MATKVADIQKGKIIMVMGFDLDTLKNQNYRE